MNIPVADLDELKKWAADEGTSVSSIIRRSLMVCRYLSAEQARGATILVQSPDDEPNQILRPLRQVGLTEEA